MQEEFLTSADENEAFKKLVAEVQTSLDEAINSDPTFRQLYQRMDREVKAASGSAVAASGAAA